MTNQSNQKSGLGEKKASLGTNLSLETKREGQANFKGPLKTHPDDVLSKANLVDQLRNQIRGVETAGRISDEVRISSGCPAVDRLLPGNGYQRGTLIQWLTSGGHGADYLSLLVARQACADGGALVVFDPLNQFYPPAVAAIGINLDNLIVLRNPTPGGSQTSQHRSFASAVNNNPRHSASDLSDELQNDFLWAIDQALRCPAVAAVWGPLDHINERWFRRFQLSAESSGCLGLFIQPICAARQPSWAEVQWVVSHDDRASKTIHREPRTSQIPATSKMPSHVATRSDSTASNHNVPTQRPRHNRPNSNANKSRNVTNRSDSIASSYNSPTRSASIAPNRNVPTRSVSKVPSHNVTTGDSPGRKSGENPTPNYQSPEGTARNQMPIDQTLNNQTLLTDQTPNDQTSKQGRPSCRASGTQINDVPNTWDLRPMLSPAVPPALNQTRNTRHHNRPTRSVSIAPNHNVTNHNVTNRNVTNRNVPTRSVSKVPSHNVTTGDSPGHKSGESSNPNHQSPEGTARNQPPNNQTPQLNEQHVRLQLTRCRGTQTGKTINLSINTITGNVQRARRDHDSHQRNRINQTNNSPTIHGRQTHHGAG